MIEKILGSMSLGFLIRSAVAGVFFVVAFCAARWGQATFVIAKGHDPLEVGSLVAIVAGITVYTLHRSLIFPWIEWGLNAKWARICRKSGRTLISRRTIKFLLGSWTRGKDAAAADEAVSASLKVWGDYLHFQYTAALCIGAGALVGLWSGNCSHVANGPLITLAITLFLAAVISNWRWHAVEDASHNNRPLSAYRPMRTAASTSQAAP